MGIDPTPFWVSLFIYLFEEEYISSLISSEKVQIRHFHSAKHFIDDLCSINDSGKFGKVFQRYTQGRLSLRLNIKEIILVS